MYHLEDKVMFLGVGDDSKSLVPANHEGRPKRSATGPTHLKDYAVEAMPSKVILMMPKNQESNKFQESR